MTVQLEVGEAWGREEGLRRGPGMEGGLRLASNDLWCVWGDYCTDGNVVQLLFCICHIRINTFIYTPRCYFHLCVTISFSLDGRCVNLPVFWSLAFYLFIYLLFHVYSVVLYPLLSPWICKSPYFLILCFFLIFLSIYLFICSCNAHWFNISAHC